MVIPWTYTSRFTRLRQIDSAGMLNEVLSPVWTQVLKVRICLERSMRLVASRLMLRENLIGRTRIAVDFYGLKMGMILTEDRPKISFLLWALALLRSTRGADRSPERSVRAHRKKRDPNGHLPGKICSLGSSEGRSMS